MILFATNSGDAKMSKPRASGDDPEAGGGVHFTEAVNPARAGMIRDGCPNRCTRPTVNPARAGMIRARSR